MHTLIIQGSSPFARQKYLATHSVGCELIHVIAEKTKITIQQIHNLNTQLSISPRMPRVVWIEEANLLSIPAQNALLKMLEEPPVSTTFYLTLRNKSSLLSTIQSRSLTITLEPQNQTDDPAVLQELKAIMLMSPGDRLASIKKLDRASTKHWLSQIESSLKSKLKEPDLNHKHAQLLSKIARLTLTAHSQLDANCSVSLVTQNYYLLLPHTHAPK